MLIKSNQVQAFELPGEGWRWATGLIDRFGSKMVTEDGQVCKEIMNLCIQIENPLSGWPIPESGWNLEGLQKYSEQLLSGENGTDFTYTYGERLRNYPEPKTEGHCRDCCGDATAWDTDQIQEIIDLLSKSPNTRRAIAITWIPYHDLGDNHVPCLQTLDYLIRGDALNCTAFFRSQDLARAWPCNVYGLAQLQKHIADEVGVEMGSLTTFSASAHIYLEV